MERREDSLRVLLARHGAVLRRVVLDVVHDATEADDVLQEILLQVWERAETYHPEKGKLIGWLITLARRRAIDRLRSLRAYRNATARFECATKGPHEADERTGFDNLVFRDEIRAMLRRHISDLPPYQRDAITLAFFHGLSQRQISSARRIPLGTIKTRLELGLRKLSAAIRDERNKIE